MNKTPDNNFDDLIDNSDPYELINWKYSSLLDSEYDDTNFVLNFDPEGVI